MRTSVEPWRNSRIDLLVAEAERIDNEIAELGSSYSGLIDLDLTLRSAVLHFELANLLLRSEIEQDYHQLAKRSASTAVMRLEEVSSAERAGNDIKASEQYLKAEGLFHDMILAGGGALLDGVPLDVRRRRYIADAVCSVLSRFAAPDENYHPLITRSSLPSWLSKIAALIAPSFVRGETDANVGIPEGEEIVLETDVVRMPLSQAILYYEDELLPSLYEQIAIEPGNVVMGRRIEAIEARLAEYRKMKFIPRSTPLILPHGYYTDGIAGYTVEGELLVSVPMVAELSSGNNLDRIQASVQTEIVRKLAGKGVSEELDGEYKDLKSLSSGLRGSSRTPGALIDGLTNFRKLKSLFPGLRVIDNRYQFKLLVDAARKGKLKQLRKAVERELEGDNGMKLLE